MRVVWGKAKKINESKSEFSFHPLSHHCADVMATFLELIQLRSLQHVLTTLAGWNSFNSVIRDRLAILTFFHDFGKANHGFQNQIFQSISFQKQPGHVKPALSLIHKGSKSFPRIEELFLQFLPWFETSDIMLNYLYASICHHGIPISQNEITREHFCKEIWETHDNVDPIQELEKLFNLTKKWFPEAWIDDSTHKLPSQNSFIHFFSGLVTWADWIGSDADKFFPYTSPDDINDPHYDRLPRAKEMAQRALRTLGINTSYAKQALGPTKVPFEKIVAKKVTMRWSQAILNGHPAEPGSWIEILEAPTGDGKTEAALMRFLELFQKGFVDSLYFALPTRTSAKSIYNRIAAIIKSVFGNSPDSPQVVLAVPGYISMDGVKGKILPNYEVLWDDHSNALKERGWACETPKRFLSAPIAVGTIDQVLLSTLNAKHSHLRASCLMRTFLVVDEVHASDKYMIKLLESVLSNLIEGGGRALLMSATLSTETTRSLLSIVNKSLNDFPKTLEEARNMPYPVFLGASHSQYYQKNMSPQFENMKSKTVKATFQHIASCPKQVAQCAIEAADQGATVLVIRNTVADCQKTQRKLEEILNTQNKNHMLFTCNGIPAPHHSRFADKDRQSLDDAIVKQFGKERPCGPKILVGTQTLQQSLDLDADYLITDLCPMDILLQRVGRLHRHDIYNRPAPFSTPQMLIVLPKMDSLSEFISQKRNSSFNGTGPHGLGSVYPNLCILETTWQTIKRHELLRIPENARTLIEESLHSNALKTLMEEDKSLWENHYENNLEVESKQYREAGFSILDRKTDISEISIAPELKKCSGTRLGEGRRVISLEPPQQSPFDNEIQSLTLPSFWSKDLPDGTKACFYCKNEEQLIFDIHGTYYTYSRLGIEKVTSTGEEINSDE